MEEIACDVVDVVPARARSVPLGAGGPLPRTCVSYQRVAGMSRIVLAPAMRVWGLPGLEGFAAAGIGEFPGGSGEVWVPFGSIDRCAGDDARLAPANVFRSYGHAPVDRQRPGDFL